MLSLLCKAINNLVMFGLRFDVKSIDCKIFLWKRNFFQVFGCILKNALEKFLRDWVVFLKML